MKCALAFCLMAILMGPVLARNNTLCHSDASVNGDCSQRIRGYTYIPSVNRCERFGTRACSVTGNFFHYRDECRLKCVRQQHNSTDEESRFIAFMNRSMSQIQDMLTNLVNFSSQ